MSPKAIMVALLLMTGGAASAADDPRAHADYYIDVFGEVSPEADAKVLRAHQVFEQVRNVAEDPIGFTPTLKVIKSDGQPWAVALPDGYVILSQGALEICYDGNNQALGDAKLAFVLGHELAHLVSRDFWHRNVFLSLSGSSQDAISEDVYDLVDGGYFDAAAEQEEARLEAIKRKELQADDAGFLYASLAGYQTTLVLAQDGREDFLSDWVRQTRTIDDQSHLGPRERSNFLKTRFGAIAAKVAFFNAGVQLAQFGRFRDAQYLFEAFAQSFPSHEVATNLGFVHLQQALQHMPKEQRHLFWLPARLVDAPALLMTARGLSSALPPLAVKHLREAEKYLNKAADARRDDITSRINLAAVYFRLGAFYKARARVEEARSLDEGNTDALVLRALILNEQEKDIDMWPVATRILHKLAGKGSLSARFNLARLYEQRGRKAEAKQEWRRLQTQVSKLPTVYREAVCTALGSSCEGFENETPAYPAALSDQELLGQFSSSKGLNGSEWEVDTLQAGPLFVERFRSPKGDEILAIDGHPVLLIDRLEKPIAMQELLACCGKADEQIPLGQRQVWKYGVEWAALIEGGVAMELWNIAR